MSGKRKRDTKDYRAIKKAKSSADIVSSLIKDTSRDSSSDDSDSDSGGAAAFSAFDLPNYGGIDDEPESEDEKQEEVKSKDSSKPGTSGSKSDSGGIIFISDPSQLPKPLNFTTPTMMQPVVLGQTQAAPAQSQVVVMPANKSPATKGQVSHVRPVLLNTSKSPIVLGGTKPQHQRSARSVAAQSSASNNLFSAMTRAVLPAPQPTQARGILPRQTNPAVRAGQSTRGVNQKGAVNMIASAASTALASGMSTSSIMQQVALAAQQAAKGVTTTTGRPQAMSTPNKKFNGNTNLTRPLFSPINANGTATNGMMRNGTQQRGGRVTNVQRQMPQQQRQVVSNNGISTAAAAHAQASKWKPYSTTLSKVAKKAARTDKQLAPTASTMTLSLKQMYGMLRLKFSTKQIYDMCLWDMEHSEASLMEIAINNAFNN